MYDRPQVFNIGGKSSEVGPYYLRHHSRDERDSYVLFGSSAGATPQRLLQPFMSLVVGIGPTWRNDGLYLSLFFV